MVNTSDSGYRSKGFEPHSGRHVVSLSKTYLPPKSTCNTQEVVAPSQHDGKIVYRDVKHQNKPKHLFLKSINKSELHSGEQDLAPKEIIHTPH